MTIRIPVVKIQMVNERTMPYEEAPHIRCPEDAARLLQTYLQHADREHFVVLPVNTKHRVNAIHTVSIGSINATIVHPREVLKVALLANAAALVVGHNHPSGDPTPSEEDITLTHRLLQACQVMGIELLDHVIIGQNRHCSLRERGVLDFTERANSQIL